MFPKQLCCKSLLYILRVGIVVADFRVRALRPWASGPAARGAVRRSRSVFAAAHQRFGGPAPCVLLPTSGQLGGLRFASAAATFPSSFSVESARSLATNEPLAHNFANTTMHSNTSRTYMCCVCLCVCVPV